MNIYKCLIMPTFMLICAPQVCIVIASFIFSCSDTFWYRLIRLDNIGKQIMTWIFFTANFSTANEPVKAVQTQSSLSRLSYMV